MKTDKVNWQGTRLHQTLAAGFLGTWRASRHQVRLLRRRAGRAWSRSKAESGGGTASGRAAVIYPDDVLIVSYPKSGNTWTRFLIGNLLYEDDATTFANVEHRVPSLYSSDEIHLRTPRPRFLKSHEYFDPRYRTVIYVVRDPRDVAISYYHFWVKVGLICEDYSIDDYVSRFLAGELDEFGSWKENVGGWLGAREGDPGFLLLRYEDMLENPLRELRRVAHFLSIQVTDERLGRAVELSSADRMRESERYDGWEAIKESRSDRAFVRNASAGGWRNELPEGSVFRIERSWGRTMERLGYPLQDGVHE